MGNKYTAENLKIRRAKREDMSYVVQMIQELADAEKMHEGPKISATDLERDCFDSDPPAFKCVVAELNSIIAIVGYAIYFPIYSTWEGRAMFLEDLYVKSSERRRGIGDKLFNAVAKDAYFEGCRLDFHVLEWNGAREFYEKKGAVNLTDSKHQLYYFTENYVGWLCYSDPSKQDLSFFDSQPVDILMGDA